MKKLIVCSIIALVTICSFQEPAVAQVKTSADLSKFYKHVADRVKYPTKARTSLIQGNNMIAFNVNKGKASGFTILNELGSDCETEVLNVLLDYPNYAELTNGKYALKLTFKLDGSASPVKNADIKAPQGYKELHVVIVGFAPANVKGSIKGKADSLKITGYGFKLRGSNADQYPKQPLVVLDDVVMEYAKLEQINPENITDITILKDASAIVAYGEKAQNGVIVIRSKDYASKKRSLNGIASGTDSVKVIGCGVKLRGMPNVNAKNPLYILDDVILEDGSFSAINPNDIKEITVLKDASSVSLYGEKGKNGVILITSNEYALKKSKK